MKSGNTSAKVIFRLALRNLTEHKSKSIIIAMFIIFGTAIVILGNSFLESINRGLEKDFRANYTGDIAISIKPPQGWQIDIFGANDSSLNGNVPQIPAIPDLDKVQQIVDSTENINLQTKLISAKVLVVPAGEEVDFSKVMENDDLGIMDLPISILFAGENTSYTQMFAGLHITEGDYPKANSSDILIDTRIKRNFEKTFQQPLNIGDKVLVAGANTKGIVREGTICGIFNPPDENSAMFQIIYCEASFARAFADLTYASSFAQELPSSVDMGLGNMSEDELFASSDDSLFSEEDSPTDILADSEVDFNNILGDTALRDELNKTDDGSWNFILIKTKYTHQVNNVIKDLNARFKEQELNVRAINWKQAAASYTATVEGIGIIFNILIIILAVVVFIIIMNTMTVSVIERTGEIGTMRALGAEKRFVRQLFFTEAISITLVSSLLGTILAIIIMVIFNALSITLENQIARIILGGGLLHFSPTPTIILLTIIIALLGSILSNIYPVSSALRITPLKALSKGGE